MAQGTAVGMGAHCWLPLRNWRARVGHCLRRAAGEKLAYLFDFGDEWRVLLTLKTIRANDRRAYPLLLAAVGDAPPQYPGEADAA